MKKSLLALAVLGAFAGAAHAQTSLTVYGVFGAGVRYVDNVNGAGDSNLTMSSTGLYSSNRLGFRGVEDLGGGMNARFTLESGFNSGTGALDNTTGVLFNRTASVGVGGAWGGVDFGRQYTNAFQTAVGYEPLSFRYPGLTDVVVFGVAGLRYNNDIKYTGTFGPVTVRAEYALGETPGSTSTNAASSISAAYASGPLYVGGTYTKRDIAGFDNDSINVGAAYKFGPARLTVGYANEEQDVAAGAADTKTRMAWAGVNYNITPALELTGAYYQTKRTGVGAANNHKRDYIIINAAYSLSKRTSLYAAIDTAKLEGARVLGFGTPTTEDRATGLSVGVNHQF
ncbi:MAG TPA: porin [Noviherbaspirillum sp.]|uniref:porin n=1 Tax=Noviherbaspirillum sp. TaxID=1926288 RepID=UPI002D30411C|nr:porin [Noviherbaspirillum sp.]HYD96715.1 porin [Noviherbaspirillum sp.]